VKKKIALVMISLLTLTVLLTTPYFTPPVASEPAVYHWRIELAQKKCDVLSFKGFLLNATGAPITGLIDMNCFQEFVFAKVVTSEIPWGIVFTLVIDWNKDGEADDIQQHIEPLERPVDPYDTEWLQFVKEQTLILSSLGPVDLSAPICTYWEPTTPPTFLYHLSSWEDTGYPWRILSHCDQIDLTNRSDPEPPPHSISWWHVEDVIPPDPAPQPRTLILSRMVVVEVHSSGLSHQWQLTMKQENCNALWTGYLTRNCSKIPGTDFSIMCNGTQMQCKVIRTPNCVIPNDINFTLKIDWDMDKRWDSIIGPIKIWLNKTTGSAPQFPWTKLEMGLNWEVELELTEVQMYKYIAMGEATNSGGKIQGPWEVYPDILHPLTNWTFNSWKIGKGTPYASREPAYTPLQAMWENITFTNKDPITGIVKLSIPSDSYVGVKHLWWSPMAAMWFNMTVYMPQQACGVLFTGDGKNPILGCVDYKVYNNYSGVYTYGLDGINGTADDELLAGKVSKTHPAYPSAGSGPPLGPCLQDLSGNDGIIGTGDDPIGRGDPDGPDKNGSSILYLPCWLDADFYNPMDPVPQWRHLYESPWPVPLTTGTAYDKVIQPGALITGFSYTLTGQRWEFLAGSDHPGSKVNWKNPYCNAYVYYVCVWSVLNTSTSLNVLDVIYISKEKRVRQDCTVISKVPEILFCDLDGDEEITIFDVSIPAKAYEQYDEHWLYPTADKAFNAMGDLVPPLGYVDIFDVGVVAKGYEWKLRHTGFIPPP